MTDRRWAKYENGVEIASGMKTLTWDKLRGARNQELRDTDHWAVKDRTMTQAKKDFRTMLRDLPQNHPDADSAADSWAAYEKPEE